MTSIPEISARRSLILWAKFQIRVGPRPCVGPRSGREGEKCRPLDHMRHIPFIHQLCSHPTVITNSRYIQTCSSYFLHVVFTLHLCPAWNIAHLLYTHALFQNHFEVILSILCEFYELSKGKGVNNKHTLIASYHPRWNAAMANTTEPSGELGKNATAQATTTAKPTTQAQPR